MQTRLCDRLKIEEPNFSINAGFNLNTSLCALILIAFNRVFSACLMLVDKEKNGESGFNVSMVLRVIESLCNIYK